MSKNNERIFNKVMNPNLNILIVDDDPNIRETLSFTLDAAGFKNLHVAENGKQALVCLEEKGIDLVFMDLDMPGMNGGQTLEEMQKRHMLRYTKVVVLTAHLEKDYVVSTRQLGASSYIVKPFTPDVIYGKMETMFQSRIVQK